MNNYEIGMIGEEAVALYLERIGCRIVDRNYRTKRGEIDIIFVENEVLVFGEVKTRNSTYFGNPAQAVDSKKMARIICLAKNYGCIIFSVGERKNSLPTLNFLQKNRNTHQISCII